MPGQELFFFLSVLTVGCYLLAGRFWGPGAGLAAAALATFAPPVQALAHQALVDLALAAMVVFAYGCWVRSERFSRLDWSLMFGLAAGIGCLVKWTCPTYLLPVVGAGVWGLVTGRDRKNIFLALVLSIIVTAPWYAANFFIVVPKLTRVAGLGAQEGDPSGRTLAGWLWYLRILLVQWGGPFLLAGVAGLGGVFFAGQKGFWPLSFGSSSATGFGVRCRIRIRVIYCPRRWFFPSDFPPFRWESPRWRPRRVFF